jgi:polysaccharide export outer membrane protein
MREFAESYCLESNPVTSSTRALLQRCRLPAAVLFASLLGLASAEAQEAAKPAAPPTAYRIQSGDILTVSVWKETDLQGDVLVRSDGGLSFPLTGDIPASGMTIEQLRAEIAKRLETFVPDAVVTVALKASGGDRIYVLGKVLRPGEFPFGKPVDVMQAISLAGGMTPYASPNSIHILRRKAGGSQSAIPFRYSDVEQGNDLDQNILLQGGDTVVVP